MKHGIKPDKIFINGFIDIRKIYEEFSRLSGIPKKYFNKKEFK